MNKKLSRKQFLMYVFTLLIGVLGFSSFFKSNKSYSKGFGSGAYGV